MYPSFYVYNPFTFEKNWEGCYFKTVMQGDKDQAGEKMLLCICCSWTMSIPLIGAVAQTNRVLHQFPEEAIMHL